MLSELLATNLTLNRSILPLKLQLIYTTSLNQMAYNNLEVQVNLILHYLALILANF